VEEGETEKRAKTDGLCIHTGRGKGRKKKGQQPKEAVKRRKDHFPLKKRSVKGGNGKERSHDAEKARRKGKGKFAEGRDNSNA